MKVNFTQAEAQLYKFWHVNRGNILLTIANIQSMDLAIKYLTDTDKDLADIVRTYGPPVYWSRKPGFSTLVHIILEQQVSLASAQATFDRLREK